MFFCGCQHVLGHLKDELSLLQFLVWHIDFFYSNSRSAVGSKVQGNPKTAIWLLQCVFQGGEKLTRPWNTTQSSAAGNNLGTIITLDLDIQCQFIITNLDTALSVPRSEVAAQTTHFSVVAGWQRNSMGNFSPSKNLAAVSLWGMKMKAANGWRPAIHSPPLAATGRCGIKAAGRDSLLRDGSM